MSFPKKILHAFATPSSEFLPKVNNPECCQCCLWLLEGDGGATATYSRAASRNRVYTPKEIKALKADGQSRRNRCHRSSRKSTNPAKRKQTRSAGDTKELSMESLVLSNTSLIQSCATLSRCHCWKKEGLMPLFAVRCCPTLPTRGSTNQRQRSATRSPSRATSINRNLCGR